ncbi:hypothetical protein HYW43_03770 [Candidatus Daviesbacteria bacterium]|nr:hypothetical protein [Candidatus Daviesbacteria bacterium]
MAVRLEAVEQRENHTLSEGIFREGELVHCVAKDAAQVISILREGLKTPHAVGTRTYSNTDNQICMSLLSKRGLPQRFQDTQAASYGHVDDNLKSPYVWMLHVGIVISRERLLAKFPSQVTAIGDFFWSTDFLAYSHYEFDEQRKSVYGIPIVISDDLRYRMVDEVRLTPVDIRNAAITPDMWTGIVVKGASLPAFQKCVEESGVDLPLPIFTPDCVPT